MQMACLFCAQVKRAWMLIFLPSGESGSFASHSCAVKNARGARGDTGALADGSSAAAGSSDEGRRPSSKTMVRRRFNFMGNEMFMASKLTALRRHGL